MSRILVLDDDRMVCLHLKSLLTSMGYTVGFILNPTILFQRLEYEPCDLIIMDVNMPKITGLELLLRCKSHPEYKDIPVLMLTSDRSEQMVVDSLNNGATDFLTKPVQAEVLKVRIKTALAAQQNKRQLEQLVEERTQELERINQTFQRFVPKQFLERILSGQFDNIGGFEEASLTILFLDIQGYTRLVEHMSPEENFLFLNTVYEMLEPVIMEHNGFVDKYIGDAMMALFEGEDSANNAVDAAIAMQRLMRKYNEKISLQNQKNQASPHEENICIRIGINTGPVMLGTVGSSTRLNSTVLGDHVNLASRLEGLNKNYYSTILISHYTHEALNHRDYLMREVDTLMVRGRSSPVLLYDVFQGDSEESRAKKTATQFLLLRGIIWYKAQEFKYAAELFRESLKIFPDDVLLLDYLKRCRYFQKYPLTEKIWDGVHRSSTALMDHTLRRISKRYDVIVSSKICPYIPGNPSYVGQTMNLSRSGCSIESPEHIALNSIGLLSLGMQETDKKISDLSDLLIQVVWSKKSTSDSKYQWSIGVEFIVIEEEQEKKMDVFFALSELQ